MQRHVLRTALCFLVACSASSNEGREATDGIAGDDEAASPGEDGSEESGDANARADGGAAAPGSDPGKNGDDDNGEFAECAGKTVDAERGPRGTNVVWVIDNSGSMDEEAIQVQEHLNLFVESITAAGLADYRVVLMTEGDFVQVPDPLGSDQEHFLQIDENVKSDEPLSALIARFDDISDFLLKGVVTHFVAVTDDESEVTAENFVTNMELRLGSEFRVHGIASPPGDNSAAMAPSSLFDDDDDSTGCVGKFGEADEPGVQYWEAAKLTDGLTFSICSEDWTPLFAELAKQVEQTAAVPCSIELPEPPAGEALDPNVINVVFTESGANREQTLPRVTDVAACADKRGWYYDDPQAPTGILLCPEACDIAASGGSLEIAVGCETFVQ